MPTSTSKATTETSPEAPILLAEEQPVPAPAEEQEVLTSVTVSEEPSWGPTPPTNEAVSFYQLQLAEFYGDTPNAAAQPHLERLEDFLRSHAVGGSNRKSEGFYGPKTRELVQAATDKYLGAPGNGSITPELVQALKVAGLEVTA